MCLMNFYDTEAELLENMCVHLTAEKHTHTHTHTHTNTFRRHQFTKSAVISLTSRSTVHHGLGLGSFAQSCDLVKYCWLTDSVLPPL